MDTKKQMIKELVKFLKRNDIYTKYIYYFYHNNLRANPYSLFNQCIVDDWILLAFDLRKTKEGFYFWVELSREWRMEINR